MSKGSGRRPQQADDKKVKDNWDSIFDNKDNDDKELEKDAELIVLESITDSNAD